MIYSKLDGTTSKKFKLGKNGVELQDNNGTLTIKENDGTIRDVGTADIRVDNVAELSDNIPSVEAVHNAVENKIRTLTPEQLETANVRPGDYLYLEKV